MLLGARSIPAGGVFPLVQPPATDSAARPAALAFAQRYRLAGCSIPGMVEITVRLLGDDEWQLFRKVRLAALQDAPDAFVARHDDEASYGEDFWRERMTLARRIVAERAAEPVGVVSLGLHNEDPETGEVFGLWTAPTVRGKRVAWELVSAAARWAAEDGRKRLYYWAVSDSASAVGFASSFGFRPTSERRPVRVADGAAEKDADEVALVLSLLADPTQTQNLSMT